MVRAESDPGGLDPAISKETPLASPYRCGGVGVFHYHTFHYQTLQTFSMGFTRGWPALQEKAAGNSRMFTTTPLTRY